ncbi:MAG: TonB-dependent receptor domain-containing protein [Gemmatimonadota bacterium]
MRTSRRKAAAAAVVAVLLLGSVSAGLTGQEPAERGATVMGRVLGGPTGRPVAATVVRIEGSGLATVTDSLGRYRITGVPAGPQMLRVERIGFAVARVAITVSAGQVLTQDIELALRALKMKEITVTADAAGRARGELGTASVIEQEAIEHLTATSLKGVLQLVPGFAVQRPGLDDVEQVALRFAPTSSSLFANSADAGVNRSAADLAAFGTLIVLDGVPLSNNANLQTLGPRGELSFTTSAGGGIDLRQIPASTIERVEVIRGIPSVRYSDLTQGAIIVDTRAAPVAPIVASKFDERTLEASAVAGRRLGRGRSAATFTLDVARTRTQPGRSDDQSTRVAAQLADRAAIGRLRTASGFLPRVTLDTRVDFFQLIDDRPENPDIRPGVEFRSRDRGVRASERARLRVSPALDLTLTSSLSMLRQNSRSRAPAVAGTQPFTDRLTEGRSVGRFIGGFFNARVKLDGTPWLSFTRLEAEGKRGWLGAAHDLRGGVVLRREWNNGPGLQFDIRFPPQVSFNGVRGYDRPRSYNEIPPLVTSGFYADDRVSARLGPLPVNLQAGVRLELLHEGGSWFTSVRDRVVQPRLNVELLPKPWLRLRGGWGRTSKTPSLADLAPAPQYFDLVNVNFFANDPAERLAVLTTFIRDPTNPDLGFSVGKKAEIGFEIGRGESVLSFVAFRDRIDGAVGIASEPQFITRDHFDLSDTPGDGLPPEIIEPPAFTDTVPVLVERPDNIFDVVNKGFELTASFPELVPLATRLQVTGSWVKTETSSQALFFGTRMRFNAFQLTTQPRAPFWEGLTETGERALVLYRLVHHQSEIGLLVTATIQHNITDRFRDIAGTDTLSFAGFLTRDARLVRVPKSERGNPEFRDLRVPRTGVSSLPMRSPGDWMASIQVSKTLPVGGKLNFWAFNFLDRRGIFFEPGVLPRVFSPVRFGFELTLPTARWLGT